MDTLKKERLISAGIDVDGVLERFMGNESLLDRMLKKFVSDGNYACLLTAVEQKDPEEALRASPHAQGTVWQFVHDGIASSLYPSGGIIPRRRSGRSLRAAPGDYFGPICG